jgi:type IV secretory pathway ATPase VirB11/archaellum biosynthesis ATPase
MPGVSTAKRFNAKSINDVAQALPRIDFDQVERGFKRILMKNNMVRPGFSYSWVQLVPPDEARPVTTYTVKDTKIGIYIVPSETMSLYHAIPPEYEMSLDYMKLVYLAKSELVKHNPKGLRMQRAEEVRNYIARLSDSIIYQMARKNRISLGETRTEEVETLSKLSDILVRHTAGFGVSEIFLDDKHIQDVFINAPASENLVNVTIGDVGDKRVNSRCRTNILLGEKDAESLLARFRYESGRPFSEASPVLEHDVKSHGTRITAIGKPISPGGIGIAMRKASMEPWTLLKLMHHGSMNALTAGLISFLLDGKSTMIVAGSRGSGKTSMLGSIMLEFPQNQRILTIEDTLELPTEKMQTLGYEIQSMFVQSTLGGKGEMNAGDALRVSLRLGESAIVLGEVRGEEARTLFESMRAGTAGSAVLGTFHADSAKAVAERITGDMGILPQSFLATDIIIIAGLSRPGGALKPKRRITQIAEVVGMKGKDEIEFADLVNYNEMADDWKETDILKYKSKVVGTIAKDFGITSEQAMQNIMVRAAYRQKMVDYARANNVMQILSAEWVIKSNNAFWNLNEKDINEHGKPDYSRILAKWEEWFKRDVRYA